jgi:hypothetical protein
MSHPPMPVTAAQAGCIHFDHHTMVPGSWGFQVLNGYGSLEFFINGCFHYFLLFMVLQFQVEKCNDKKKFTDQSFIF